MKEKPTSLRCVAYPYDLHFQGCDYVPPPLLGNVSPALREVFDGNCPFVYQFRSGVYGYCVVCSREPNAAEIKEIEAAAPKAPSRYGVWSPGNRSQVFVVDHDPET